MRKVSNIVTARVWRWHACARPLYTCGMSATRQPVLPRYWAECSTRDISLSVGENTVAVLPIGATEQHGPHLATGVDAQLADGIVRASLEHLDADVRVLFLPTQSVGFSVEHEAFAGTLSLSVETVMATWEQLGLAVARSGIRKLVLFNTHGGHVGLIEAVGRKLRAQASMAVWSVHWWQLPGLEAKSAAMAPFDAHEQRYGVHAGQVETAMMRHLAPELVRMEHAQNFTSRSSERMLKHPTLGNGRSAKLGWSMADYNPLGACGNAAAATVEQGRVLVEAAGRGLAQVLSECATVPLIDLHAHPAWPSVGIISQT